MASSGQWVRRGDRIVVLDAFESAGGHPAVDEISRRVDELAAAGATEQEAVQELLDEFGLEAEAGGLGALRTLWARRAAKVALALALGGAATGASQGTTDPYAYLDYVSSDRARRERPLVERPGPVRRGAGPPGGGGRRRGGQPPAGGGGGKSRTSPRPRPWQGPRPNIPAGTFPRGRRR